MNTLETVAPEVAARLVDPKSADAARREAQRIISGKSGTSQLSADLLVIVSVAVQVCSVAVGMANLYAGLKRSKEEQLKRSKEEQVIEILQKIAENTGDASLANDENLINVASIAVDVINESQGLK